MLSRRRRAEQGSVAIAVLVMMVATIAVAGVFQTVHGSLQLSRNDQNRSNAFQYANAGIDLALYRIDRRNLPTSDAAPYHVLPDTVNGGMLGFEDELTVGGSRFHVTATKTPPGQDMIWTVRSVGTDPSGRQRQAIATITASSLFPNAFFSIKDFYLTGTQTTPVAYRSSVCPMATPDCELTPPIPARIGTNGSFTGSSATYAAFSSMWEGFNMYGRTEQADADMACASGGCGTYPKVLAIPNRLGTETPSVPAGAQSCPSGGNVDGRTTAAVLQPGDYVCDSLLLQGTVTIGTGGNGTGTVRIWIEPASATSGGFSVADNAVVNRFQPPSKLQIYEPEAPGSTAYPGSVCGAEIWALLYTPGLAIDCNGSHQPNIYGAVVAQLHHNTGNHFDFHYDIQSFTAVHDGKYAIKDWRECPVSVSDC